MSEALIDLYWQGQDVPLNFYYAATKQRVTRPLQIGDVIRKKLSYRNGGLWFHAASVHGQFGDHLEESANIIGCISIWDQNANKAAEQGELLVKFLVLDKYANLAFDDLELVETYTLEEMLLHENGQIRLAGRYFNGETQPIVR